MEELTQLLKSSVLLASILLTASLVYGASTTITPPPLGQGGVVPIEPQRVTVAQLAAITPAAGTNPQYLVTDSDGSDNGCEQAAATVESQVPIVCYWNNLAFVIVGRPIPPTPTREQVRAAGNVVTGAISRETANIERGPFGGECRSWWSGEIPRRECVDSQGNAMSHSFELATGNYWELLNAAQVPLLKVTESDGLTVGGQHLFSHIAVGTNCSVNPDDEFNWLGAVYPAANEVNVTIPVPAMTATELRVQLSAAMPAGQTGTYTLRQNGANTIMQCTVAAGASTCSDLVSPVVFVAGDLIAYRQQCTGGTTAIASVKTTIKARVP